VEGLEEVDILVVGEGGLLVSQAKHQPIGPVKAAHKLLEVREENTLTNAPFCRGHLASVEVAAPELQQQGEEGAGGVVVLATTLQEEVQALFIRPHKPS